VQSSSTVANNHFGCSTQIASLATEKLHVSAAQEGLPRIVFELAKS
jgi:hypothetical protein